VAHGGSYFEGSEWWTAPRHFNLAGELRVMIPEMLFLEALRKSNRALWYRSFPFHFGLYLLAGSAGLLLLAAFAVVLGGGLPGGPFGSVLRWLAATTGIVGLVLSFCGACALLQRRLSEPSLRSYTTVGDIFNLAFFVAVLGLIGVGYAVRPDGSPGALVIATGLLSWDSTLHVPGALAAGLFAGAALTAYIPLTHMSHFVGKYFTYHAVRWDDTPLAADPRMTAKLAEYLTYRPTWSAAHIRTNESGTWADVVSSNPGEAHR
jgi:nitrate reductase gamma subunit